MRSLAAAALISALVLPGAAKAEDSPRNCNASLETVRLANALPRVARKLASGEAVKIVAIGSSSTAGAGASSPALSYPSRLQVELVKLFPRQAFDVVNRGVNGEEAADMMKRFDAQVVAEKPDLILWQFGTNSVLRDHAVTDRGASIRGGIEALKKTGADVVLVDPQYAPKVILKPDFEPMLALMASMAKSENVDLFQRFALMKRWYDVDRMTFAEFVSADGLHMNDWSYGCLAKSMAAAIAEAATRPVTSASAIAR